MLRFGTAATASLVLPRVARAWRQRHPASVMAEPAAVHTYEEGAEGRPVPSGSEGVVKVSGAPVFSAADAVHGDMGFVASATYGGGQLVYANPNVGASSGSVYLTPHAVESGAATVVGLKQGSSAKSFLARVRLRSDYRLDIVDVGGVQQAISKAIWSPGQRMRLDWQQIGDGTNVEMKVWAYTGANVEGWRPDVALTAGFASPAAVNVSLAAPYSSASMGFDTYREFDAAGMPAPYNPTVGATALHTYDDGLDGGVVSPGQPGADGVVGVGGNPKYSTLAALHGPIGVAISRSSAGVLRYDNPYPPAHTGSVYVRSVRRGATASRIVTIQNGLTVLAQIQVSSGGTVRITDPAGAVRAETTAKARLDRWTRIDWQATWDGVDLSVAVRYFVVTAEGIDNYSAAGAVLPCTVTPDTLGLGSNATGWQLHIDTLRTYGDVTAWPSPFVPAVTHVFSLVGDAAPDGVLVSSMVFNASAVDLAVSQSSDMTGPFFVGARSTDGDGLVKHLVGGLTPSTQYYARLATSDGALFGDQIAFRTLPERGRPIAHMKVALLSCQQSVLTDASELGWHDVLAWDPDLVLHGGDFGYWGGTLDPAQGYQGQLAAYQRQFAQLPTMRRLLMTRPSLIQVSDHETSGNDGDNYNDLLSEQALTAYQKLMPITAFADTRNPIRGRFVARNLGANIRLVSIDFRSLDRSPGAWEDGVIQPDGSLKTALGQQQMDWLTGELRRPEALKIILSDPAWGPADPPTLPISKKYLDKWWSYRSSQQAIADIVAKGTTVTGGPINVDFWGNDRHLLGYLSASRNPMGAFPVLCGSGIDQHALALFAGELYDQTFGASRDNTAPVRHYMRIELSDDNVGLITRTASGWDCISQSEKVHAVDTWSYVPV